MGAEHLAREHYLDIVVPGLVAALEGLISSSQRQVTRQMVNRIPALAVELGVAGVSKNLVRKMYAARSQGAHGADIELLKASSRHGEQRLDWADGRPISRTVPSAARS